MSSKKKFVLDEDAIAVITRNGGLVVRPMKDELGHVTRGQVGFNKPGLKVLSAMDYLHNYCGYQTSYTST